MARLVLATMGSWGDLFPTIGLARAAAARGHTVSIAATPAYSELIESEGLAAAPVGPRFGPKEFAADPAILDGRQGGFAGFLHLFQSVVFPNLVDWVDDLRQVVVGSDLLLSHPTVIATPIAAELAGTPWATFSVFPGLIPSAHTFPSPTRLRLPRGLVGRQLRRAAWRTARWNIARFFDPPVNAARSAVGLAPVHDALFLPVASGNAYLVGASRHVVEAPPDWPPNVRLTGFFAWDSPTSLQPPSGLEAFLSEGPAPVLITLGGSSAVDPRGFYPAAVAAVRSLGQRALVLAGPTPAPIRLEPDPQVFPCPFAPLSKVAARCTAAIHHGGIGTTVALLAAGLPQLIVPRGFDQPQTALRMERLGVAVTLPWKRATSPMLRRRLEKVLGTNEYRRQASMLSRAIQEEDGLRHAADEIERLLLTL